MSDVVVLQLVSPERLLLERDADMVVVPGAEGDFGVLAGHSSFMCGLRAGLLAVYDGGEVVDRFFISGGFAEVSGDRCSVLVDGAESLGDLDEGAVVREVSDREDDLKIVSEEDKEKAEKALEVARVKLEVLRAPSY